MLPARTDDLQGHLASSALLVPPCLMACHRIRNRFKQALTGSRSRQGQVRQARCKPRRPANLASLVSLAHRVNPAFSALRESMSLLVPRSLHSSLTTLHPASIPTIQPAQALRISRLRLTLRTTVCRQSAQIVAHGGIVAAVADVTRDQARMIETARASRAYPMIPMRSPQSLLTGSGCLLRRASPTGCSTILAMARLHLAPIPARLVTQAVRWIARRDATAITVKSVPKAHRRCALAKARATA